MLSQRSPNILNINHTLVKLRWMNSEIGHVQMWNKYDIIRFIFYGTSEAFFEFSNPGFSLTSVSVSRSTCRQSAACQAQSCRWSWTRWWTSRQGSTRRSSRRWRGRRSPRHCLPRWPPIKVRSVHTKQLFYKSLRAHDLIVLNHHNYRTGCGKTPTWMCIQIRLRWKCFHLRWAQIRRTEENRITKHFIYILINSNRVLLPCWTVLLKRLHTEVSCNTRTQFPAEFPMFERADEGASGRCVTACVGVWSIWLPAVAYHHVSILW